MKKISGFVKWVSQPLMTELTTFEALLEQLRHIVIKDHLILVKGVHIFYLDPTLLNLEVCSLTFIHLKVST
jgi:hypothetical protein